MIYILSFCAGTTFFGVVLNAIYFLVWPQQFGQVQNILGPVEGQGMKLMHCPFTGPKMFCAGPNFLSQPKNLTAFSASSKTFVPAQKTILQNANHLFVLHKMFGTATICK